MGELCTCGHPRLVHTGDSGVCVMVCPCNEMCDESKAERHRVLQRDTIARDANEARLMREARKEVERLRQFLEDIRRVCFEVGDKRSAISAVYHIDHLVDAALAGRPPKGMPVKPTMPANHDFTTGARLPDTKREAKP